MGVKSEKIIINAIGEEIHILYDEAGREVSRVKDYRPEWHLFSGNEYCPNCRVLCKHVGGKYICSKCDYEVSEEDAENGYGYPTLEATYEDDYGD